MLYPGSKLKTIEYLSRHYQEHYSTSSVYRYLDKLNKEYKEQIQQLSYRHTLKLFNNTLSVVFYDVTTLYFEASKEDELRKTGFSKDGKPQNPQIVLGLLVTTGGYPLAFEMFEGNKYEGDTLIPVSEHLKNKYNSGKLVVVADAGLLSKRNMELLVKQGYEFILGARIKNETTEIKQQILSKKWGAGIFHEFKKDQSLRLIVDYSEKRAKKDTYNRNNGIKRLEKHIKTGRLTKENINNKQHH